MKKVLFVGLYLIGIAAIAGEFTATTNWVTAFPASVARRGFVLVNTSTNNSLTVGLGTNVAVQLNANGGSWTECGSGTPAGDIKIKASTNGVTAVGEEW